MPRPDARTTWSETLAGTRFTDVRWVDETASTNADALALARSGDPEGIVVVADHQTAGRGRRGRTWTAPPGASLLFSVLLRPPAVVMEATTMAVALAVAEAVEEVTGVAPRLKWPNDLVLPASGAGSSGRIDVDSTSDAAPGGAAPGGAAPGGAAPGGAAPGGAAPGGAAPGGAAPGGAAPGGAAPGGAAPGGVDRKLGGILAEADWPAGSDVAAGYRRPAPRQRVVVVVGVGLNVNWPADLPDELAESATAISHVTGGPVDRVDLLVAILRRLDRHYGALLAGDRSAVFDAWRTRSATLGRRVRVDLGPDDVEGTAVDVTDDGHLVVLTDEGGRRTFAVGDVVHLRPLTG